jgi:hypothetical protein
MDTLKKGHPMKRPDHIGMYEWYEMTEEEQRRELHPIEAAPRVAPNREPKPRKPKASKKAAPAQQIKPRTIEEAFALVNGQLMRRCVALVEIVQKDNTRYTRQVERLIVCGDRVRFGDRVLLSKVVAHYLTTGQLVDRAPRDKPAPRYKAQVRDGARVLHLGYFATKGDRDAAVFAYRLGLTPSK